MATGTNVHLWQKQVEDLKQFLHYVLARNFHDFLVFSNVFDLEVCIKILQRMKIFFSFSAEND